MAERAFWIMKNSGEIENIMSASNSLNQNLSLTNLRGERISLQETLEDGPLILCFGMPQIHASRLVVHYLRRLKEQQPKVQMVIVVQGEEPSVRAYNDGYLDSLQVIYDKDLKVSQHFNTVYIPTLHYFTKEGGVEKADYSFTGFKRYSMNKLASRVAQETGGKAKELITTNDNKGEYELAELGLFLGDDSSS